MPVRYPHPPTTRPPRATSPAAKGRLAPGFDADILAVDGNPSPTSTPPHRPVPPGDTPATTTRQRMLNQTPRVQFQNRAICTGQQARFTKLTGAPIRRSGVSAGGLPYYIP